MASAKPAQELRVLKHPLASRLYHVCLIAGFLPAAVTGFILWLKPGSPDFVNLAMRIHIAGAALFTVSSLLYALFCLDRVAAFCRRSFRWNRDDLKWMMVAGGYPQKMFLGKKVPVPPMGKINSGQKVFGICLFFGGILLIATGWILYAAIPFAPKLFVYWADRLHWAAGIFLGLFLCVHIFLGIYNWAECKSMFADGTQPLDEAREYNPVWVETEVEPAAGQRQPSA